MDIQLGASIETDTLACTLTEQLTPNELFEFIRNIDLLMADWGFTDMLIAYFEAEKAKKEKEKL